MKRDSVVTWTAAGALFAGSLLLCADPDASGARAATRLTVPLEVTPADGVEIPSGTPVSPGVPFPEGALVEPERLQLRTKEGEPLPAQFEVRQRHAGSDSVRWLGVHFALRSADRAYELVETEEPAEAASSTARVRIEDDDEAITVDTGPLRAEVPRGGGLLRRVWLDGRLVLEQQETNFLVRAPQGERYSDRHGSGGAVVEKKGPLHAVVRVFGRYGASGGDRTSRWTARLHFHAGRPAVRISHTFVWIGSAEALQIQELSLGFRLSEPALRGWADRSSAVGDGAYARALDSGEFLSLLQDRHRHWGHGESHFAVRSGVADEPNTLGEGRRAGSWVAAANGDVGVAVTLRELWQNYPKELRATPQGLTVGLWSARGGSGALDLRPAALERWWGSPMLRQLREPRFREDLERISDPARHDPTGLARTHDLELWFFRTPVETEELEARADAFDREPLVLPAPEWTESTGVLGRLGARRPSNEGELERHIEIVWEDVAALVEDWGDYGFLGYGAGPHYKYELVEGRAIASPRRYGGGVEYGYAKAAWLAYLRSGEREIYELARAHSRFLDDLLLCHEGSRSRRRGDWLWRPDGTLLPWEGVPPPKGKETPPWLGHRRSFGFFIEHALLGYAVTGDARLLDGARLYADALLEFIDSHESWPGSYLAELNHAGSRWAFQRLHELAVLYEQFRTPALRDRAKALAKALLDPDHPSGVRPFPAHAGAPAGEAPRYLFYKGPNVTSALRAFQGEGRRRAERSIVAMAEHALRTLSHEARSVGLRMAQAHRVAEAPRMLAFARKRAAEYRQAHRSEPRGLEGYRIALSGVPAQAYNSVTNEGHLVRVLRETSGIPETFPIVWKAPARPEATIVLPKRPDRPLTATLSAQSVELRGPEGQDGSSWLEAPTLYHAAGEQKPWEYRELRVSAGAPAGLYRLSVGTREGAQILASNTERHALVAPQGFELGRGAGEAWYFSVPEGTQAFSLRASDPGLVELRDRRGNPLPLQKPRSDPTQRIRVGGERPAGLWSARASGPTDFAVYGIPPVFAHGSADRLAPLEAAARPPPTPAEHGQKSGFTTGRVGRGLRIAENDALVLRAPSGGTLPLDSEQGTIELFVRPDWSSTHLPHGALRSLLELLGEEGTLDLFYAHGLTRDQRPFWDVRLRLRPPSSGATQTGAPARNDASVRWSAMEWTHVAFTWYPSKRGLRWAFFLDGRVDATRQGHGQPLPAVIPRALKELWVGGDAAGKRASLQGTVDSLRLSSTARYRPDANRRVTTLPVPRRLDVDADTLALFRFEDDLEPSGRRASSFAAELRKRAP